MTSNGNPVFISLDMEGVERNITQVAAQAYELLKDGSVKPLDTFNSYYMPAHPEEYSYAKLAEKLHVEGSVSKERALKEAYIKQQQVANGQIVGSMYDKGQQKALKEFIEKYGGLVVGHNINQFDIPNLFDENDRPSNLHTADTLIGIRNIRAPTYNVDTGRPVYQDNTLSSVFGLYEGKTPEQAGFTAHNALDDQAMTARVFGHMSAGHMPFEYKTGADGTLYRVGAGATPKSVLDNALAIQRITREPTLNLAYKETLVNGETSQLTSTPLPSEIHIPDVGTYSFKEPTPDQAASLAAQTGLGDDSFSVEGPAEAGDSSQTYMDTVLSALIKNEEYSRSFNQRLLGKLNESVGGLTAAQNAATRAGQVSTVKQMIKYSSNYWDEFMNNAGVLKSDRDRMKVLARETLKQQTKDAATAIINREASSANPDRDLIDYLQTSLIKDSFDEDWQEQVAAIRGQTAKFRKSFEDNWKNKRRADSIQLTLAKAGKDIDNSPTLQHLSTLFKTDAPIDNAQMDIVNTLFQRERLEDAEAKTAQKAETAKLKKRSKVASWASSLSRSPYGVNKPVTASLMSAAIGDEEISDEQYADLQKQYLTAKSAVSVEEANAKAQKTVAKQFIDASKRRTKAAKLVTSLSKLGDSGSELQQEISDALATGASISEDQLLDFQERAADRQAEVSLSRAGHEKVMTSLKNRNAFRDAQWQLKQEGMSFSFIEDTLSQKGPITAEQVDKLQEVIAEEEDPERRMRHGQDQLLRQLSYSRPGLASLISEKDRETPDKFAEALTRATKELQLFYGVIGEIKRYDYSQYVSARESQIQGTMSAASGVVPEQVLAPVKRFSAAAIQNYRMIWEPHKQRWASGEAIHKGLAGLIPTLIGAATGGVGGAIAGSIIGSAVNQDISSIFGGITQLWGHNKEKNLNVAGDMLQRNLNLLGGIQDIVMGPIRTIGSILRRASSLLRGTWGFMTSQLTNLANPLTSMTGSAYQRYMNTTVGDVVAGVSQGSINQSIEGFTQAQHNLYNYGQLDEKRLVAAAMLGVFGDVYKAGGGEESYYDTVDKLYARMQTDAKGTLAGARQIDPVIAQLLQAMKVVGVSSARDFLDPRRRGMYWTPITERERPRMMNAEFEWTAAFKQWQTGTHRVAVKLWEVFGKPVSNAINEVLDMIANGDWRGAIAKVKTVLSDLWGALKGTLSGSFKLPDWRTPIIKGLQFVADAAIDIWALCAKKVVQVITPALDYLAGLRFSIDKDENGRWGLKITTASHERAVNAADESGGWAAYDKKTKSWTILDQARRDAQGWQLKAGSKVNLREYAGNLWEALFADEDVDKSIPEGLLHGDKQFWTNVISKGQLTQELIDKANIGEDSPRARALLEEVLGVQTLRKLYGDTFTPADDKQAMELAAFLIPGGTSLQEKFNDLYREGWKGVPFRSTFDTSYIEEGIDETAAHTKRVVGDMIDSGVTAAGNAANATLNIVLDGKEVGKVVTDWVSGKTSVLPIGDVALQGNSLVVHSKMSSTGVTQ